MKLKKYLNPRNYIRRIWNYVPPSRKTHLRYSGYHKLAFRKMLYPLFQHTVTLMSDEGVRFLVTSDPVDERVLLHIHSKREEYFPPKIFGRLPPDPVVLDIGAHHGFYAVQALALYTNSRIICVEPAREGVELLRKHLEMNNCSHKARVVQAALAENTGEGTLLHCVRGSWGNSLYEDDAHVTGGETVPLLTLQQIIHHDKPEIVKCNAEGAEFTFVSQLIASDVRPLLVTIYVHDRFGDMNKLLRDMQEAGYLADAFGTAERPAYHFWLDAP